MKNHHDEHNSDDKWAFEQNKLYEEAVAEFDNAIDAIRKENGGKRKKEEITKRPRARAIPWEEEEHR